MNKNSKFKKMSHKMLKVGLELNKLESLSRILMNSLREGENLKPWDAENLSSVLVKKIIHTKKQFNEIEQFLGI